MAYTADEEKKEERIIDGLTEHEACMLAKNIFAKIKSMPIDAETHHTKKSFFGFPKGMQIEKIYQWFLQEFGETIDSWMNQQDAETIQSSVETLLCL